MWLGLDNFTPEKRIRWLTNTLGRCSGDINLFKFVKKKSLVWHSKESNWSTKTSSSFIYIYIYIPFNVLLTCCFIAVFLQTNYEKWCDISFISEYVVFVIPKLWSNDKRNNTKNRFKKGTNVLVKANSTTFYDGFCVLIGFISAALEIQYHHSNAQRHKDLFVIFFLRVV